MGGELVHEIDFHTQPKSVAVIPVLFVLNYLLCCIDVYIVQVLADRHMTFLTQKC